MKKNKIANRYQKAYNDNLRENDSNIVISFKYTCDNHCLLENWKKEDLKKLSSGLKRLSQLTWNELPSYAGFHYKHIPQTSLNKPLPTNISKDENIFEIRIDNNSPRRIFAFRSQQAFNIIWFDLNHSITDC